MIVVVEDIEAVHRRLRATPAVLEEVDLSVTADEAVATEEEETAMETVAITTEEAAVVINLLKSTFFILD